MSSTICCGQTLTANPPYSHTMSASSAFQGLVHEFNRREIAPYKNRYVRGTFSESRRPDRVSAQAIIQVTAEAPLLDLTTEVMIGCGRSEEHTSELQSR